MGQSNSELLQNQIFELKFNSKSLERAAKKCEKLENQEKNKIKKALESKDKEKAKIFAENAIRQKNQGLTFLKLAARMDGIAQRLQSVQAQQLMNKNMEQVTKVISQSMKSMNLEKNITTMDRFEKQCEELDVQLNVVDSSLKQANSSLTQDTQVDNLLKQVADENGLEVQTELNAEAIQVPSKKVEEKDNNDKEEEKLAERFKNLEKEIKT